MGRSRFPPTPDGSASSILAQGVDQVYAATILGHARVSTTNRYTHGKINERSIAAGNAAYGVTGPDEG